MMVRKKISVPRRPLLRGLGCAVAVPWLESMGPMVNWARGASTPVAKAAPNRMPFTYVPNGKTMKDWPPATEGADSDLPAILEPLKAVRDQINILTGLAADKARAHGDGGGDHARAMAAFLTGAQPRKTDGTDIRSGISIDQVAAARLGDQTRLASLEIGCEPGSMAGNCDSGYSCVYSSTMSWRSATTPLPKEINPKLAFQRLFGSGGNGVRDGHHDLSHHGNDATKKQRIRDINRFHVTQLAYLLEKLKSIPEGDGALLDHCMIAYGSGNSDGNAHNHDDLPILLAGGGCGTIKTGRHIRYNKDTPLNNLWMSMLDRMQVNVDAIGDATGRLKGLDA